MKRNGLLISFILLLPLLLSACAAQPPVPQDNYYRIKIVPPASGKRVLDGVVEVERFSADGLTAGRPIVYSDSSSLHEVRAYHYHYWTESPTIMVRDALVDYLRAWGLAEAVVIPEMRLDAAFIISGKIIRLERVMGQVPGTVVELQLSARRVGDESLGLLKDYRLDAEGATESVSDAVVAINRGLAGIFAEFTSDLATIAAKSSW